MRAGLLFATRSPFEGHTVGKRSATLFAVLFACLAVGLTAWLFLGDRDPGGERPVSENEAEPTRKTVRPAIEAPTQTARTSESAGAPKPEATPPPNADLLADPAQTLLDALRDADKNAHGMEVLDVERLVEKALRARPELLSALAEAFGELENRELAFRLGLLLARHVGDPRVRAAMLEAIRNGKEAPREAALQALYGLQNDPEVAGAIAGAFHDGDASSNVRAAAAFGLSSMMDQLPPSAREQARSEARGLVLSPSVHPDIRKEALDLLDVARNSADRAQVRLLLEPDPATPPAVTLEAARVLLSNGEPQDDVLPYLQRLAQSGNLDPTVAKSLQAVLEEIENPTPDHR
jgi:hypothetical protein